MPDSSSPKEPPEEFANRLKAARAGRSSQGERRIVTILFCDVVGSTSLAEQLDPEDWAEIMDDAFDFLIEPIYRYEGTVARLMGDAILAFFGAPVAHEDDPQRAILAGLDITASIQPFREQVLAEYGMDFNVRVGINTGPVVVGQIGSDLAMEYTAMGDAVNLAARMEQTAKAGSVQIAEDTHRLVAPLFDFEALGGIEVKGKTQPVQSYRVLGKKDRPGPVRGIQGLMSPLIGRDRESQVLVQAFDELRQGRGQIVALIGEAGLGKSRLLDEAHAEWLMLDNKPGSWFESRGISYDTDRAYGLFQQHLRQVCGIEEGDAPEMVRQKFLQNMGADMAAEQREILLRSVEMLLATEMDSSKPHLEGEAFKRQLFGAVFNIWRQTAAQSPVVLVFDDLHWADRASVELLVHILRLTEEVPILFLCAFRPYRQAPAWKVKQAAERHYPHRYQELFLKALSDEDSSALVSNLLSVSDLSPRLRRLVLEKAEGNPFFVEEVVRTLIESGVVVRDQSSGHWLSVKDIDEIAIPDNLQAVLAARMDRLERGVRQTLQLASVIGRSFNQRVLEHVSARNGDLKGHLNHLQRVELIREESRVPEPEYTFLHELTRDAAYRSILRRNRKEYHRRVGEALETLNPDRVEQQAHILARHFEQAQDADKAVHYYTLAGDTAARLYANEEAVAQYTHALEIVKNRSTASETLKYLYTRRGRAYEMYGQYDAALNNYRELQAIAQERDDQVLELAALIPQTTIHSIPTAKQDSERGRVLSQRALDLAQRLHDHRAEAKALWNLMLLSNFIDRDYQKAVAFGEQALQIARTHNLREELAYVLNDIARVYLEIGRQADSQSSLQEAQQMWRQLENQPMLADNLASMASGLHILGEYDQAIDLAEEALEIARSIGNQWVQAYSLSILGPLYLEQGDVDRSINAFKEAFPLAEQADFGGAIIFIPVLLAWVYGYLGDFETGITLLDSVSKQSEDQSGLFRGYVNLIHSQLYLLRDEPEKAASVLDQVGKGFFDHEIDVYFGPLIVALRGEVALANKDYENALDLAETSIAWMRGINGRLFVPDLLYLKGRALLGLGRSQEGYDTVVSAYREARDQNSRRSLWPILVTLADLEVERGEPARAEAMRKQARRVIAYIAHHIGNQRLLKAFLALPQVRAIAPEDQQ